MRSINLFFFFLCCTFFYNACSQLHTLRFDQALTRLRHLHLTNFNNLLDDDIIRTGLTSDQVVTSLSSKSLHNQSSQCQLDLELLLESVSRKEQWALKTLDAWGKPLPSGILKGNIWWIGNYDECLQPVYQASNKSYLPQPFETQHCRLSPNPSSSGNSSLPISIVLGVCVPSSCDRSSLVAVIHSVLPDYHITPNDIACSNDPANGQKNLTVGALVITTVISILGALVLLGTVVDLIIASKTTKVTRRNSGVNGNGHFAEKDDDAHVTLVGGSSGYEPSAWMKGLAEYSALRSLSRIFSTKQQKNHETFEFINGIRVLSLFWVIIGHTFLFPIYFTSNPVNVTIWTRNVAMQLISSAPFSVDTFFMLSGFLTAVLFVRQVDKHGKLSPRFMFLYYIHRYIRLTPTFLLVVFISIHLTPYLGNGPAYPTQQGFESPQCRSEYWWTSILYVGNLVKPDYMCLGIAWYLHNDMQFHWIAPLCLIPFVLGRKAIGFVMAILFTLVGIGSTAGLLIYYPDLQSTAAGEAAAPGDQTFFNTIYITPWCRISAYFIGVLTGFIVVNTGRTFRLSKRVVWIGNILAILFALACLFAFYPDSILVPGIDRVSFIVYQSLSRTIWSICIGWLVFICITHRGGVVNKILCWSIWDPLARLNYSTYLIHFTVILLTIFNQRNPFYYQPHSVVNLFVSQVFFSYAAGTVVNIFFETPFFLLEKRLFKR